MTSEIVIFIIDTEKYQLEATISNLSMRRHGKVTMNLLGLANIIGLFLSGLNFTPNNITVRCYIGALYVASSVGIVILTYYLHEW